MTYPTELVALAKHEVNIFERPSADTSLALIAEVEMLRSLVREMRAAALEVGGRFIGIEYPGTKFEALIRMSVVIDESKQSVPDQE